MLTFKDIALGAGERRDTHCALCASHAQTPADASSVNVRLEKACASQDGHFDGVMFTGFEPFAHPQLVGFIAQARQLGAPRIALLTDGGALSSFPNAAGSIEAGVRIFEIPLLGAQARGHDRLSQKAGLFDALVQGIGNVCSIAEQTSASVMLVARIELCPHNASEILSLCQCAAENNFDAVHLVAANGYELDSATVEQAAQLLIVQGIALFGDGIEALNGARLYRLESLDGELI